MKEFLTPDGIILGSVFIFVIGSCIGSFLNVCIWRIPRGESIVHPPSRCPECDTRLSWHENFPIFGWLVLRGKCKTCKTPISPQYILMELLVALLYIGVWFKVLHYGQSPAILLPYLISAGFVVTTFFIDLRHYIIPNLTTYFCMAAGVAFAIAFPQLWDESIWYMSAFQSLQALAICYVVLALFSKAGKFIFKEEALGMGDVKYMAAIGALLGLKAAFLILLVGSILGSVAGIALIIFKKKGTKTSIPFGPYLAVATYAWLICDQMISAYLYL